MTFAQGERELTQRASRHTYQNFHGILSKNSQMHRLFVTIQRAAKTKAPIFICGETGVGKELVAKALHLESSRSKEPFIAFNAANFSHDLIESQLFGHKKGAFTGAIDDAEGLLRSAKQGTLFLDEITCLPVNIQAKLLRVLQEKQFYPVGDFNTKTFNASLISASNLSLKEAVTYDNFREDLRYRIEVIPLYVPPLRKRKEDIILLFRHFLNETSGINEWVIDRSLQSALTNYRWPGNIRELENCAQFVATMANSTTLKLYNFPKSIQESNEKAPDNHTPLDADIILQALDGNKGNRSKAARELSISRMTLWRKMKEFDLA